jgi:hypothetical protein
MDFDQILSHLEGAQDLMEDSQAKEAVRGVEEREKPKKGPTTIFGLIYAVLKMFGVIEILKQLLQPIFGESVVKLIDSIDDGAELASVLNQLGVSREQGVKMVRMLVDFMKDKLDSDTVDKLVEQVPALKVFLAEDKKEE